MVTTKHYRTIEEHKFPDLKGLKQEAEREQFSLSFSLNFNLITKPEAGRVKILLLYQGREVRNDDILYCV